MTVQHIVVLPCTTESASLAATENFFRESKGTFFPIPDRIDTFDLLAYWVMQGFGGLSETVELRLVKKIERRVLALGTIKRLDVFEELLSQLQRLDGRCRYHNSLSITKRTVQNLKRPITRVPSLVLAFDSSRDELMP